MASAPGLGRAVLVLTTDDQGLVTGVEHAEGKVKGFQKTTKDTGDSLGELGKQIKGAFAAGAIVAFTQKVLDFAGSMVDLSAKTGIGTDALQAWKLEFGGAGVSIDTVTDAATRLSKAIIGDDKGVVNVLTQLGLNVANLKTQRPEEMFTAVADAIGKIENPAEKAFAAMTVFGKAGAELLPALNGHLAESVEKFREMGLIVEESTLVAADNFGDQLGLLGQQLLGVTATILGPLLPGLSALAELLMYVGGIIRDVLVFAIKVFQTVVGTLMARIAEMLAFFTELAQKIPFVGEKMQFLSTATAMLKGFAEGTSEAVGNLWIETEKVGETAVKTKPKLIGLTGATENHERATKKATTAARNFADEMARGAREGIQVFAREIKYLQEPDVLPGAIRGMEQFALKGEGLVRVLESRVIPALERTNIGLFTMNTTAQNTPPALDAAGDSALGFWGKLGRLFTGATTDTESFLGGFSTLFGNTMRGLFGGQGGGGVLEGIVATGLTNLGNLLFPGFGNLLAGLAPIISAGLAALGGLFADFFSWVWGGFKAIGRAIADFFTSDSPFTADPGVGIPSAPAPPGSGDDVPNLPPFSTGTMGQYLNFGSGTPVMLHGWEKITPLGEREGHTTIIEVDGRQMWKAFEPFASADLLGRRRLRAT